MNIKLYQCCDRLDSYSTKNSNQLGIGYLKSNCTNADIEIVKNKKELRNCDLIALSSFQYGIFEAIEILHSTDIPVIIGGPISQWNKLSEYNFKHIVVGEGEVALNSIVDGNETEKIVSKPLIKDLDILNFSDRGECGDSIPILSSRGCVNKCSFCGTPNFWKKYRWHSPEYFIEETEYILKRYPHVTTLVIQDNLFAGNRKVFDKLYDIWMTKGLNKRLKLWGCVRTSNFDYEFARKLKKMNFHRLAFGFESGSNTTLKMLNKETTVEDHQNAIDLCYSLGIICHANFIRNIPGERQEDMRETVRFIIKNRKKLDSPVSHEFVPYPGCDMYNSEDGLDMNIMDPDVKISRKNINQIKQKINFKANISYEEGLDKSIKWYSSI